MTDEEKIFQRINEDFKWVNENGKWVTVREPKSQQQTPDQLTHPPTTHGT